MSHEGFGGLEFPTKPENSGERREFAGDSHKREPEPQNPETSQEPPEALLLVFPYICLIIRRVDEEPAAARAARYAICETAPA